MLARHRALRLGFIVSLAALLLGMPAQVFAAATSPSFNDGLSDRATRAPGAFTSTLLAKAQPDECFAGIGVNYPPGPPCSSGIPKVNQAYVWGLTQAGKDLWFGTAPNVHCLVIGTFLQQTQPIQTDSYVCEFGQSQPARTLGVPAAIGDWRPPRIYTYDTTTGQLTDRSPNMDPRFRLTLGLRSAGSLNDVVFLAGPALSTGGGINIFAFRASTFQYLGSQTLPQYDNIRKWIVYNGVLYTAVHNTAGGGSVLRWTGNATNPFAFEVVGSLDGDGADLAIFEGRLFVSTWPEFSLGQSALAGLWMSPLIDPSAGLTPAAANGWTKVWSVDRYEPDPVTAATYGGGALMSYGGYLYWGTMHVPMLAAVAHMQVYGTPSNVTQALALISGTQRAISIFRGKDFGTWRQRVQLLYGERALPVYTPGRGWTFQPTRAGAPLYGHSGFGNPFNNYTWTMGVYRGQLFVGTMDWSYLFPDMVKQVGSLLFGFPLDRLPSIPVLGAGADLWRFPTPFSAAVAENTHGMGNPTNYGIRTMLVTDNAMYLGMANPMNLLTQPGRPQGGWELIRLQ